MTTVGKKVHAALERSKRSQGDIAKEAGVSRSWLASVATGRTVKPAPDKLARLATVLGLDARELLALTDQLGAPLPMPEPDLASAIREQAAAIEHLATVLEQDRGDGTALGRSAGGCPSSTPRRIRYRSVSLATMVRRSSGSIVERGTAASSPPGMDESGPSAGLPIAPVAMVGGLYRIRRAVTTDLRPARVAQVLIAVTVLFAGCNSSASAPTVDPTILTNRQATLDMLAVSSDCDILRAGLAGSQLLLDGEDRDDAHAYGRELEQTASAQMDRMRC